MLHVKVPFLTQIKAKAKIRIDTSKSPASHQRNNLVQPIVQPHTHYQISKKLLLPKKIKLKEAIVSINPHSKNTNKSNHSPVQNISTLSFFNERRKSHIDQKSKAPLFRVRRVSGKQITIFLNKRKSTVESRNNQLKIHRTDAISEFRKHRVSANPNEGPRCEIDSDRDTVIEKDCENDYSLLYESLLMKRVIDE